MKNSISKKEVKERILDYLSEESDLRKEQIDDDLNFFEQGLLDSLGFAMFIDFLTSELNFEVHENEIVEENFLTLNKLLKYLKKKEVIA